MGQILPALHYPSLISLSHIQRFYFHSEKVSSFSPQPKPPPPPRKPGVTTVSHVHTYVLDTITTLDQVSCSLSLIVFWPQAHIHHPRHRHRHQCPADFGQIHLPRRKRDNSVNA